MAKIFHDPNKKSPVPLLLTSCTVPNNKTILLSKCNICGRKISKFIKKQEVNGLLCSLGPKTPLSKISLLGDILF